MGIWLNFTGMIPGWSPIKVVQTVPVGCISRSQGQSIGFKIKLSKISCLKQQGQVLSYLIYKIIKRSSTKVVQIMPLGFSIIGSTVTFDLFLRWATLGPSGPSCLILFRLCLNKNDERERQFVQCIHLFRERERESYLKLYNNWQTAVVN